MAYITSGFMVKNFSLVEMTNKQAKLMTSSANLDYIAMMCDIELDEPDGEEVPTDGAKPEL